MQIFIIRLPLLSTNTLLNLIFIFLLLLLHNTELSYYIILSYHITLS